MWFIWTPINFEKGKIEPPFQNPNRAAISICCTGLGKGQIKIAHFFIWLQKKTQYHIIRAWGNFWCFYVLIWFGSRSELLRFRPLPDSKPFALNCCCRILSASICDWRSASPIGAKTPGKCLENNVTLSWQYWALRVLRFFKIPCTTEGERLNGGADSRHSVNNKKKEWEWIHSMIASICPSDKKSSEL